MGLWAGWSRGSNFVLITFVFKSMAANHPSCDVFLVENIDLSKQGKKKSNIYCIAMEKERNKQRLLHF